MIHELFHYTLTIRQYHNGMYMEPYENCPIQSGLYKGIMYGFESCKVYKLYLNNKFDKDLSFS